MSAFSFSRYEDFFSDVLKSHEGDRGYRTKLARAARVHPSYITRICSGTAAITPDQAAALAEFWGLEAGEREYFLWLVLKGRSGDPAMKKLADEKLRELKQTQDELGRFLPAEKIDSSQENEYFMNWLFPAFHVFSTLKTGLTSEQISRRLGVPESLGKAVVNSLVKMELVELREGKFLRATKKNIHLSNRSWMSALQHRNWRVASTERIGRPGNDDLHYSGAHSLSKRDLEKLRRQVREFLLQTDKLVRPSEEETVCVLCLDLYEL